MPSTTLSSSNSDDVKYLKQLQTIDRNKERYGRGEE